jgi:signal transduction histidine kinase
MIEDGTDGSPLVGTADHALLRIIFNNLFDNAVAYSKPDGRIRIDGKREGDEIVIRVANPALDFPEDPERLFEPLFRHELSRHDAGSHLGIGLTLSREAAHSMGGDLRVDRTGEDLVFILVFPAAKR